MSTKITPQLRFPEFADEWKVRKLGDITQINPRVGSLPDDFVYIDLDSVKRGTLLKQNRISKIGSPSRAQRLLSRDDIIYQTVRPYQKNNFYFDKAGDYVASTGYAQIRAREGYYPRFVYTLLHTSAFVNKVLVRSTGTNYPAINSNDLAKVKVHTPSKPEQEKIADFLTAVDERIAVSEKKLELLETYKRGVMQKIFSQQIRFKGENGTPYPDWEVRKLGEVATKVGIRNKSTSATDVLTNSAVHGVILQTDFFDKEIAVQGNLSNYYKTQIDDFVYNPRISTNAPVGPFKRNNYGDGVMSPLYNIFRFNESKSLDYFEQYLATNYWHKYMRDVANYGARSDRMAISSSDLLSLPFPYPSQEEQQKIATFLTTLDDKITVEKSKLAAARKFKKALLQRMFV